MLVKEARNQNSFSKSMTDISLLTQDVCSLDPTIPQLHNNYKLVFEKKMELKKESIGNLVSESSKQYEECEEKTTLYKLPHSLIRT